MIFISVFTSCAAAQSGSLLNIGFGHRLQFNKKVRKCVLVSICIKVSLFTMAPGESSPPVPTTSVSSAYSKIVTIPQ